MGSVGVRRNMEKLTKNIISLNRTLFKRREKFRISVQAAILWKHMVIANGPSQHNLSILFSERHTSFHASYNPLAKLCAVQHCVLLVD
jgi:hypothetical protein